MIVESAAHLGATFLEIRPWMRRSISTTLSEIRRRSRCSYQDMVPVGNLGAALGQSIVWIYLAAEEPSMVGVDRLAGGGPLPDDAPA